MYLRLHARACKIEKLCDRFWRPSSAQSWSRAISLGGDKPLCTHCLSLCFTELACFPETEVSSAAAISAQTHASNPEFYSCPNPSLCPSPHPSP
eukprot:6174614-Pleurochrysis_carterae.AAC.1